MKVLSLIQAAGVGTRLGQGPKAFVMLAGSTLLEHAVRTALWVSDCVLIAVSNEDRKRAVGLFSNSNVQFIEGGTTRSESTRCLVEAACADFLLLHDVVHPLVSRSVVISTVEAAMQYRAAAPAITNVDFLYRLDGTVLHYPGEVWIGQKPVAFSREAALAAYCNSSVTSLKDPGILQILELVGVGAHFVRGDSLNIKITVPSDLSLAEAMMELNNRQILTSDAPPYLTQ